jgi:hypothetical protein
MRESYLVTDVGSTTTKAVLIGEKDGEYRLLGRGEHPTTVEAPHEDVTVGVAGALKNLESRTALPTPLKCLSTSSAGSGLQMLVFGVMRNVTADSGDRRGTSCALPGIMILKNATSAWRELVTAAC